jgi:hypothetical protein
LPKGEQMCAPKDCITQADGLRRRASGQGTHIDLRQVPHDLNA